MKLIFFFSLALGLASCSKQESISPVAKSLQDGLVAYYPLNGNLLDVSGNLRHAKLDKAVFSVDHLGKSKASLVFSSVQPTAAEVPSGLLKQTSTICFWAKKSDAKLPLFIWDNQFERQEKVAGITTSSRYGFSLGAEGSSQNYSLELKLGVLSIFRMNIPFTPNLWEFYVIQFSEVKGITTSGEVTVYKNGVRFMQQTVGAVFLNALESSGVNRMGGGFPKGLNAEGQIDELGIWSRTLTEAEILQLYKNGF
jgi:hypothetical protein